MLSSLRPDHAERAALAIADHPAFWIPCADARCSHPKARAGRRRSRERDPRPRSIDRLWARHRSREDASARRRLGSAAGERSLRRGRNRRPYGRRPSRDSQARPDGSARAIRGETRSWLGDDGWREPGERSPGSADESLSPPGLWLSLPGWTCRRSKAQPGGPGSEPLAQTWQRAAGRLTQP